MVTERYSLNVTPGGVPLVLNVSQYDVGLRQFIFTPYTNEGILPKQDMVTVTLEATKRDGNGIIHPCTYNDDGTITYVLQDQLAPVKGKVFSKIRLRGVDSENLGMAAIIWVVDQAGVDDDTQFSDSDVAAIEEWLRLGAEYVVRTESAAEAAAESEANAKESENAAKASENAAAASETAAKASENAAKASENAAAASETNADISERNAYNSAANALVSERNAKDSEIRAKASENAAAASETVAVEKATEAVNTIDNFNSNLQDLVSEAVEGLYIHSDSVVIDKTLSIEGAAAEASETGKRIAGAMNMFPTAKATSLGPVVTYEGTVDGVPVKTFTYTIEPHQAGTGDPSPDNIRAITGYTSVDVTRAGKNLLDPSAKTTPSTAFVWYYKGTGYLFRAGVTYTLSLSVAAPSLRIVSLDESAVLAQAATGVAYVTYTPTVDTLGVIRIWNNAGFPEDMTVQLEIGSTATDYEPYVGTTETIPFPASAGTVYGGTLTKNADGSGTLTATMATVDLGTLNWNYGGDGYFQSASTPDIKPVASQDIAANILCSIYATDTSQHVYGKTVDKAIAISTGTANVRVRDTSYTDAATFKTALSGGTLVYEVATPTTYAISASDMAEIPTLLGDNTVWMSADGEFTSFEYRVGRIIDPTLTVEGASADAKATGEAIEAVKEIISDEDTITVTSNYAVGSLVRVGDALYETTTVVVTGETLSPGTNCTPTTIKDQLIKRYTKSDTDSLLSEKADTDGNYPDLTAGNANQLVATVGIEDETPYLFRTSGGGLEIGDREIDEIVGGTVAWNQVIQNGDFSDGATGWKAQTARSSLSVSDGIATVTHVSSDLSAFNPALRVLCPGVLNHVYLVDIEAKYPADTSMYFGGNPVPFPAQAFTANTWGSYLKVVKATSSTSARNLFTYIGATSTAGFSTGDAIQFRKLRVHDLTAMFGSTIADYVYSLERSIAGAGVQWFRNLFPEDYYEYDPGSLKSVEGLSAHQMVGFNQWDEEWEVGGLVWATGADTVNAQARRTDFIRVIPGASYYITSPNWSGGLVWYDANKAFVNNAVVGFNRAFTAPSTAAYVRVCWTSVTSENKSGICINLSSDRNGEYEPYDVHSYPLDSTLTLRGIPKLDSSNRLYYDGDTYESDGQVQRRYVLVDLGTLIWNKSSTIRNGFVATGNLPADFPLAPSTLAVPNWIVSKGYLVVSNAAMDNDGDKRIAYRVSGSNKGIIINDSAYSTIYEQFDAATFQAAMSGVYLLYEKATPTTEQAAPYTNPQIVDNLGTEEYVTSGIVPVGHNTKYLQDLKSKLESAPDSPDADGDYIMRQTSGVNSYAPLASAPAINNLTTRMSTAEGNIADVTPKAEEALVRATAALIIETATGTVVTIDDGADGIDSKSYTLNIEPHQAGSGDPSPDNIRAITGYTSVDVTRAGKNLLGGLTFGQGIVDAVDNPSNTFLGSDANGDYVQFTGGYPLTGKNITPNLRFQPNTQYTLIFALLRVNTDGSKATNITVAYTNGTKIQITLPTGTTANTKVATVFTTAANMTVDHIELGFYSGTIHLYYDESGIFEGAVTADDFVPYEGQTEAVTFPSNAGTVYGGTLVKNEDGSGTLTVMHGLFNQWNKLNRGKVNDAGTGRTFYALWTNMGDFRNPRPFPLISNYLQSVDSPRTYEALGVAQVYRNNADYFVFCTENPDDTLETMQQWVTANGIQVYVALATPVEYTIPAEDMAEIPTLKGANTVWMSADGSISLDYYADTKLYINKLLSQ